MGNCGVDCFPVDTSSPKVTIDTDKNKNPSNIINILHFNDVYNIEAEIKKDCDGNIISCIGGASKFQTLINKFKTSLPSNEEAMILFSGDFLSPSSIGSITNGKHMIGIMNNIGITCGCLGNHDLDYGNKQTIEVIKELNYPVVNTNILTPKTAIYDEKNDDDLMTVGETLKSYIYKYNDNINVGIIGISHDWTATIGIKPENGFVYKPFIKECQKYVDKLNNENKIDLMIVLTHAATINDQLLSEKIKGVDLILGGHNHIKYHQINKNTKIIIVKSGSDFKNISWIKLQIETNISSETETETSIYKQIESDLSKSLNDKKIFIGWRYKSIIRYYNIDNNIKSDDVTDEIILKVTKEFNDKSQKVIGILESDLDATFKTIRSKESNAGNFITDVVRKLYNIDGVILNSGSIRADRIITAGNITFGDILDLVPFGNPMVVISVYGSTIIKLLEHGVKTLPVLDGGFPQMSGIKMLFDINGTPWSRIKKAWINTDHNDDDQYELIQDNNIYKIAMNSHMAKGNGGRDFMRDSIIQWIVDEEEGIPCYTILQNFFNGVNHINNKLMEKQNDDKKNNDDDDDGNSDDYNTDDDYDENENKMDNKEMNKLMMRLGGLKPTKSSISLLKYKQNNDKNKVNVLSIAPTLRNSMMTIDQIDDT